MIHDNEAFFCAFVKRKTPDWKKFAYFAYMLESGM